MTAAKAPSARAHHLLKFAHQEMKVVEMSLRKACARAGVSYNTAKDALQGRSNISLASTEALLNVLGYTMKPTPIKHAVEAKPSPKPPARRYAMVRPPEDARA